MAFKIDIKQITKTSTKGHRYYLEGAPGLAGDPRVDPVLALATYLLVRGENDGYLFTAFKACSSGSYEMRVEVRLTDQAFLAGLREALDEAGVEAYRFLGTHSFKRGGVQLFKQLGVPDAEIKERGFWETDEAYHAYLQSCNRLARRFTYASPLAAAADVLAAGQTLDAIAMRELLR